MILDEELELKLKSPFKVSSGGDKADASIIVLKPPYPAMAKDIFKIKKYFSIMQKEAAAFASNIHKEAIQEAAPVLGTGNIESLHENYDDSKEKNRDELLKEIEETTEGFLSLVDLCSDVDFYKMTVDFSKMVINNNRCYIKAINVDGVEVKENMTITIWEQQVSTEDRLDAVIKYSCFFGLTSSIGK